MTTWTIHADGSALGNPGPAGWAAHISAGGESIILRGGAEIDTNNRMEMLAVAHAMRWLATRVLPGDQVMFRLDSEYVIKGVTEWMTGWKKNGWKNSAKKPVANREIWEDLDMRHDALASAVAKLSFVWVKGHSGDELNEVVDKNAKAVAALFKAGSPRALTENAKTTALLQVAEDIRRSDPAHLRLLDAGLRPNALQGLPAQDVMDVYASLSTMPNPVLLQGYRWCDDEGEYFLDAEEFTEFRESGAIIHPHYGEVVENVQPIPFWYAPERPAPSHEISLG